MEFHLLDHENKLSKTQQQKIKKLLRQGTPKEQVLGSIHYPERVTPYEDYSIVPMENNASRIIFSTHSPRTLLKKRLQEQIQRKTMERNNSFVDEKWKTYYHIIKQVDEKHRPSIPDPDLIRSQADAFRMLLQQQGMNPAMKDYIETCLS